jgi:hypothetical protein
MTDADSPDRGSVAVVPDGSERRKRRYVANLAIGAVKAQYA